MSRSAVTEILDRSVLDKDFLLAIQANPEGVFEEFDLTDEERSALLSRNLKTAFHLKVLFTIRFALIRNIVALRPPLDDSRRAELRSRGDEIVRMQGDRIEPIKELFARMR